ncbi:hypothetical protein [Streptomyces chartreusis]|uniref:hypothetical protein n=1 Tax=Streptomyces chartreusis TaxID=1969 RepID=UPI003D70EE79
MGRALRRLTAPHAASGLPLSLARPAPFGVPISLRRPVIYHAVYWHYLDQTCADAVCSADRLTSLADARAAMCLATGVDVEDVDPTDGYNISRRAYESSRRSWVDHMKGSGLSYYYVRPDLEEVVARWTRRRPQFVEGDDWAAAGVRAHLDYWQERGGRCRSDECLIHDAGRLRFEAGYASGGEGAGERVAAWTVGETHATLTDPRGREADRIAMPVGADEGTALSVIMEHWGEDLTRWDRIPQEAEHPPGADDVPQAAPGHAPPTPSEDAYRLF